MIRHWLQTHRILVGIVVLVSLGALPILWYPMWRDHGMYANIARTILQGGQPFIDMWDIKPPPIYYLYAFAISLFGETTWAVRTLDLMLVPFGMVGLYLIGAWITQHRSYAVGAWGAGFYGVFYFTETYASLSQSDSLVTVLMIWGVVCATLSVSAPRGSRSAWGWSVICGALCGVMLWFKHYNAFVIAALILYQLSARHGLPWREALGFTFGGLLGAGGLLLIFYPLVPEMVIVAQGTAAYNAQGYDFALFLNSMSNYLGFRWRHWGALIVFAALWLPMQRLVPQTQRGWGLIGLWLLAGLGFMLIQAKGFDTHWLLMLPPLALFAGDGWHRALLALNRMPRLRMAFFIMSVALLSAILLRSTWVRALPYALGQESLGEFWAKFDEGGDVRPAESLAMVQWLQAQPVMPRGQSLFIWGFRPEVYYMGGWRIPTRYQAQFPLVATWYPAEWRDQHAAIMWAAMPPFVLVLQNDYMPWVTGYDQDSHQLLVEYSALSDWLSANYQRLEVQIGDFLIWQRKE